MNSVQFDFNSTYNLENEVALLSPLHKDHIALLGPISADPAIWTYFLEKADGLPTLKPYLFNAILKREEKQEYPFVIFDKRKNQYAGITRLYAYDSTLRIIKIGHTWIGKDFHGTGLNKNCKFLLFEFLFEQIGIERIGFGVHGENIVSMKALESVGCKQEGKLRNFLTQTDGVGRTDLLLFSILYNEWLIKVKRMLAKKINSKK